MTDHVASGHQLLLTDPMVPTCGEAVVTRLNHDNEPELNSKSDVEASVEENLACGSDHDPILTAS